MLFLLFVSSDVVCVLLLTAFLFLFIYSIHCHTSINLHVLPFYLYVNKKCAVFKDASKFNQTWCSTKWQNSPIIPSDFEGTAGAKSICCNSGSFFNSSQKVCEKCDSGQYNNLSDVTDTLPTSCKVCSRNTFGPIKGMPECSSCKSNQYR